MTTRLVQAEAEEEIQGWFAGRIPDGWFTEAPEITADREEILVVGRIPEPDYQKGASTAAKSAARAARIARYREETRDRRIGVALEAEHLFRRKVSWGVECGDLRRLFTTLSVPVMTRLRMEGRAILDVLVDAGVARSRSEALAWCVRLVGENQEKWLKDLKKAFEGVERVRAAGPDVEQV
ncbi:MAG: hypothetical protein ACRDH9_11950 [Actinomycetota bacterium]